MGTPSQYKKNQPELFTRLIRYSGEFHQSEIESPPKPAPRYMLNLINNFGNISRRPLKIKLFLSFQRVHIATIQNRNYIFFLMLSCLACVWYAQKCCIPQRASSSSTPNQLKISFHTDLEKVHWKKYVSQTHQSYHIKDTDYYLYPHSSC